MVSMNRTSFLFARRALALTVLLGAGVAGAQTQTSAAASPKLNLTLPAATAEDTYSSSNSQIELAVAENRFDFVNAANMQPPPRRSRPRYRGGNTNPDGSNKYAFLVGGGFTQPVGNTYHYLKPSYGFQVGGGRNFNQQFGLLAQFDWDNFGFTGRTIAGQNYIYNRVFGAGAVSQLDGNTHIWSITLNPTFNLIPADRGGIGMYAVGGVGFYHKAAHFFVPTAGLCYDVYYGYYQCTANQDIDKYTSNAPGVNGGIGFTYKVSRFSGQRLYGEIRYQYVANRQRNGITVATAAPTAAQQAATNFFPANSNRTTYFPVKFGIRF